MNAKGETEEVKTFYSRYIFLPPESETDSFFFMLKAPDISTQQLLSVLIQTQTKLQSCDTVNSGKGWTFTQGK